MRHWATKRDMRELRIESGRHLAAGKLVAQENLAAFLPAVIRPSDRVCLEGDNQKQADAITRVLAAVDPVKAHELHMVQSGVGT